MNHRVNSALAAASLLLGVLMISGCPSAPHQPVGTPGPSTQPTTTGYQAKDYFYPSSPTQSDTYAFTNSFEWPGASASANATATASITSTVATYSATTAVLQEHFVGQVIIDPGTGAKTNVDSTTYATVSIRPDGSILEEPQFGPKRVTPNTALSASGATVVEASGSEPATTLSLAGAESITVDAGPFNALKLVENSVSNQPNVTSIPNYLWVAKGPGRVKSGYTSTESVMVNGQIMTATQSQWIILTHYTP